jgi:hypothetical protein
MADYGGLEGERQDRMTLFYWLFGGFTSTE